MLIFMQSLNPSTVSETVGVCAGLGLQIKFI